MRDCENYQKYLGLNIITWDLSQVGMIFSQTSFLISPCSRNKSKYSFLFLFLLFFSPVKKLLSWPLFHPSVYPFFTFIPIMDTDSEETSLKCSVWGLSKPMGIIAFQVDLLSIERIGWKCLNLFSGDLFFRDDLKYCTYNGKIIFLLSL